MIYLRFVSENDTKKDRLNFLVLKFIYQMSLPLIVLHSDTVPEGRASRKLKKTKESEIRTCLRIVEFNFLEALVSFQDCVSPNTALGHLCICHARLCFTPRMLRRFRTTVYLILKFKLSATTICYPLCSGDISATGCKFIVNPKN